MGTHAWNPANPKRGSEPRVVFLHFCVAHPAREGEKCARVRTGYHRNLVLVQNVSKLYRLYRRPSDRLRELLPGSAPVHQDFWALKDISFGLEKGETLGLVGPNGCGKSTLLQIVSGILQPTSGRVVTRGRIAALLELGAGFNPEFSGRENVFLNGEIMGLSRAEIERAMPAIERFAEIGEWSGSPPGCQHTPR